MRFDSTPRKISTTALAALTLAVMLPLSSAGDLQERALAAYDAGDCAEALPLLREIDAAGDAGGAWLYRLYYCQRETGDAASRQTVGRAREALERDFAEAPTLETGFYLANAYRNAARLSAAAEVASQVTSGIESKELPGPTTPMETFQLGKLYADQDKLDRAAALYANALEGLVVADQPAPPSAQWAARFLAERAWTEERWADVAKYYDMLATGDRSVEDLDRMAIALVRQGEYMKASRAWFDALRLNPAGGDRPRYCAQLANQAADVAPLPETAPDGRSWDELVGEDLGQILFEQSQFANTTLQAYTADPDSYDKQQKAELREQLQTARAYFMRAGLEATVRGIPLRETAFQSGYAPLIFHKSRWDLPAPKPKRWRHEPVKADPQTDESEGS